MKQDTVSAQKAIILQAQAQALEAGLGACYDQGLADAPPAGVGFTQADIDAAVAAAQAVDAQALAAAQAQAQSDIAAVQSALDAMTSKEQLEEGAVADVKASILQVQASFDAIKALLVPEVPALPTGV